MNRENLAKVIQAIKTASDINFDMNQWVTDVRDASGHLCGTAGCIAGWTYSVMLDKPLSLSMLENFNHHDAANFLDLSDEEEWELFLGTGMSFSATREEAIQVLEHLLNTGEVNWEIIPRIAEEREAQRKSWDDDAAF